MMQLPTTPSTHGPRGANLDLRYVLLPTASRLLHTRHPRQVTTYAALHSLHNSVTNVPGKAQAQSNRMGDAFSRKEASAILSSVCEGFDAPAMALKKSVENLYLGPGMFGAKTRLLNSTAKRLAIKGISFGGDNVGTVRQIFFKLGVTDVCLLASISHPQTVVARFNKGESNSNYFLNQTMQMMFEHRLATAHMRLVK